MMVCCCLVCLCPGCDLLIDTSYCNTTLGGLMHIVTISDGGKIQTDQRGGMEWQRGLGTI